jgi:hypothetical protein
MVMHSGLESIMVSNMHTILYVCNYFYHAL